MKPSLRFKILARDGFQCRYCGAGPHNVRLQVDHIHPVSRGGEDDPDNLVTACWDCNIGKGAKLIPPPRGVPMFELAEKLRSALEAFDHEYWHGDGSHYSSERRHKIRDLGTAIYEFSGTAGMNAISEMLEDDCASSCVVHLDCLWDGIGQWAY